MDASAKCEVPNVGPMEAGLNSIDSGLERTEDLLSQILSKLIPVLSDNPQKPEQEKSLCSGSSTLTRSLFGKAAHIERVNEILEDLRDRIEI